MDCSTSGLPVLHYLLEFAHTHTHWVGDAIQHQHGCNTCFYIFLLFQIKFVLSVQKILIEYLQVELSAMMWELQDELRAGVPTDWVKEHLWEAVRIRWYLRDEEELPRGGRGQEEYPRKKDQHVQRPVKWERACCFKELKEFQGAWGTGKERVGTKNETGEAIRVRSQGLCKASLGFGLHCTGRTFWVLIKQDEWKNLKNTWKRKEQGKSGDKESN